LAKPISLLFGNKFEKNNQAHSIKNLRKSPSSDNTNYQIFLNWETSRIGRISKMNRATNATYHSSSSNRIASNPNQVRTSPTLRSLLSFWTTLLFISTMSFLAHGQQNGEPSNSCEIFSSADFISANTSATESFYVEGSRHRLSDLLRPGKANLAATSPMVVMWSAQRIYALFTAVAPERVWSSGILPTKVTQYPLLSEPRPENGGRYIVGHKETIADIMNLLAIARLDPNSSAAKKVPLLEGTSGTGKTEFLDILVNILRNLSTKNDTYKFWTFRFVDLIKIPQLVEVLPTERNARGELYIPPVESSSLQSPLFLLPEAFQQAVLDQPEVQASVQRICNCSPKPVNNLAPGMQFIAKKIVEFYTSKSKGFTELTPEQRARLMVSFLENHVEIVEYDPRNIARIDAQPKDPKFDQLFVGTVAINTALGKMDHPLSYTYSGSILRNNGLMVFMDELLRNDPSLLDMMLGLMESRSFRMGGAPQVRVDAWVIAATNTESVEEAKSAASLKAKLDRMARFPMELLIHPLEIAEATMLMNGVGSFEQRRLIGYEEQKADLYEDGLAKWTPANIKELFIPRSSIQTQIQGPDRRYAIRYRTADYSGEKIVEIAPHALTFMASIASATRSSNDVESAAQLLKDRTKPVSLREPLFTDLAHRIRMYLGDVDRPQNSVLTELADLTKLLKEGSFGISQRDLAANWFAGAIGRAVDDGSNTVTVETIAKTFLAELGTKKDGITYPNEEARLRWIDLSRQVLRDVIEPRINQDVTEAMARGLASVESVYDEVILEITELQKDNTATQYQNAEGSIIPINRKRLEKVMALYTKETRRTFSIAEILSANLTGGIDRHRDTNLMTAVSMFITETTSAQYTIQNLLQARNSGASGSDESIRAHELIRTMIRYKGYNEHSAVEALKIMQGYKVLGE